MVRKITWSAVGLLAVALGAGALNAEDKKEDKKDEKALTVEEIMKKGHSGGTKSLLSKIKTSAKDEKWEDAQTSANLLKALGEGLAKTKADKGDAASWKKFTEKYAKTTADISAGAEKKDAKAVNTGLAALGKSCKECHDIHKE